MEAIKCPNCGSEKCQELTKEKWNCLACDNMFLIHNLSKEFKKTDEHIDKVHQDLKKAIHDVIDSGKGDLDLEYKSAMSLYKRKEYDRAKKRFHDITEKYVWSYKGFYGKFLLSCCQDKRFDSEKYELIKAINKSDDVSEAVKKEINDYLSKLKEKMMLSAEERLTGALEEEEQAEMDWSVIKDTEHETIDKLVQERKKLVKENEKLVKEKEEEKKNLAEEKDKISIKSKKIEKSEGLLSIIECVVSGFVSLLVLIKAGGWVISSTRSLFSSALDENFIDMIWQFLVYGFFTIIKIGILGVAVVGIFYAVMLVLGSVVDMMVRRKLSEHEERGQEIAKKIKNQEKEVEESHLYDEIDNQLHAAQGKFNAAKNRLYRAKSNLKEAKEYSKFCESLKVEDIKTFEKIIYFKE